MPLTKIKSENIDATGNLSIDAGTLFIDATNDRVGIGNTSPTHKLSVNGTTNLAGAVTGITTLSAGNTSITGFANISGDSQFSGNVGIGTTASSNSRLYITDSVSLDTTYYGMLANMTDSNTAITASRNRYAVTSIIENNSENKTSGGDTTYNSSYLGNYSIARNGDPTTGGDARANYVEAGRFYALQYANGVNSNTVGYLAGTRASAYQYGSGVVTSAYGLYGSVEAGNNSVTGNVTTAIGVHSSVKSNTSMTIDTGYLYYGQHFGATTTTPWGIYLNGEAKNYLSGNLGISNTSPTHKLSVNGTTYLAGNTTITGFANVGSNINAASFNVGATQFANTTGTYANFFNGADATQYGRLVYTSPSSGLDPNYWTKICTWSSGSIQFIDCNLLLAITNGATGGLDSAIVAVFFRENATGANPTVDVEMISKSGAYGHIGADSFKVVTGGFGTNMELWMQKKINYGAFRIFEISRVVTGGTLTYTTGSSWQATEPTGAVNNIKTSGVDIYTDLNVGGNTAITGDLTVAGGQIYTSTENTKDKLHLWGTSNLYTIGMQSSITYGGLGDYAMTFKFNEDVDRGFWWGHNNHTNDQGAMALTTGGKLTVAESMRLGYGVSDATTPGATYALDVNGTAYFGNDVTISDNAPVLYLTDSNATDATTYLGYIDFRDSLNVRAGYIGFGSSGNPDFYIVPSGATSDLVLAPGGSEKARIDSTGHALVGTSSAFALTSTGTGAQLRSEGSARFYIDSECPLELSRQTNDGVMTRFRRDGALVAQITVASGVLTYGTFTGSHIATLNERNEFDIPVGTILEVDDDFTIWKQVKFEDEGGVLRKVAYTGEASIGSVISYEYKGVIYQAEVIEEGKDSYLKKDVTVKISDTVESKNVYGVFAHWDNYPTDEDEYWYGDMIIASIGTYVIRISGDYEVEKGDLIVSNGDGTGKPQSDDIVRSKTVAKVINTTKQVVYDDGSYLVACSLHCG